jgi:hypothetical protein
MNTTTFLAHRLLGALVLALCFGNVHASMARPDLDHFYSSRNRYLYTPKIVCCKNNAKFNDPSTALKLEVASADSSIPRFDENFEIPHVESGHSLTFSIYSYYLGSPSANLKVGDYWYSVSEIIGKVDAVRTNIMLAMKGNMREYKDTLLLDLPGLKKTMDSLNSKMGSRRYSDFFSSINLNLMHDADSRVESIDLLTLKEDSCMSNTYAKLSGIDFNLNTDSVYLDLGPLKKDSPLNAVVSFDFKISKFKENPELNTNFKSFVLEMPGLTSENTKGWPARIKEGNYKIFLSKDGAKDNLELIDEIGEVYFSLKGYYWALDIVEIPFLEKKEFSYGKSKYSIREIVENLDEYLHIVQYGVDCAIGDDNKINLSDAKKVMDSIFVKKIPLGGVSILNRTLRDVRKEYDERDFVKLYGDSLQAVTGSVPLHEGANYIVLKIWPPQFEYDSKLDLNMVNTRDFKAEVAVYVKILIYVSKKSLTLVYDSLILDKVDLAMPNHVYSMDAGMFNVKFGDGHEESYGKLRYNVSINSKNADSIFRANPSMIVDFDSLTFMLDHSIVTPLKNKGGKGKFSYDFDRDEWIMPTPLKRFTSFSGEDLLAHVYAIGNSLRDLRNYVDGFRNTDSSAVEMKKVSDAVENFDWIVFGGSPKQNDSRLVENTKGTFKKHFSNLLDFSGHFNKSWKEVFKGNNKIKVCEVDFLDEKKKSIPVVNRLFKGKIAYVKITFRLDLGLRPDFAQEWERILRKRLAEFPTKAQVAFSRDGKLIIDLLVEFK